MKVNELCSIIENVAPVELADDWDNVGLLIGDKNSTITGVVTCVDLSFGAIDYAIEHNCNMIVTHHPVIFTPLKRIVYSDYSSDLVIKCIENHINVYAAHTNMDMADNGINFTFFTKLNIKAERFLNDGLGVFGEFNGDLDKLLLKVKEITNEKSLKFYKAKNANLAEKCKIAFISGSGGRIEEVVNKCAEKEITIFISSEFKHNILLELLANNISVIEIGHFESEIIFTEIIYNLLENKISNLYKYVSLI